MTQSYKIENWLLWQNSIQPFNYSTEFTKKVLVDISAGNTPLKIEIENSSLETLKPMEKIKREVMKCNGCRLSSTKKNFVFGEGNLEAPVMFIGEGPGEDEDNSGRPFVGKAGQLLTKIIENGMKIPRESVYIANIVKCRPPSNRDPLPDEASACIGYLKRQIETINPKVIVLLGKVAAKHLLGLETTITKARETTYSYGNIKVFVTYHPSALLRNEDYKRPVWEDIKKVMSYLETVQRP